MDRQPWCVALSSVIGGVAYVRMPFAEANPLLQLVALQSPLVFYGIKYAYLTMLFTTPYVAFSVVFAVGYIFLARRTPKMGAVVLPPYPDAATRTQPSVVVGEVHHSTRPTPSERAGWLTIPERGLYTGIAIFGAVGSGKTSGCIYPFADQLLAYRAADPGQRIGGLVLEVKGDFCHKVRQILTTHGRSKDFVEVSLTSSVRYNPLHNDLDAYALAFGIASLLNNLFGKGREPFWQQAYTNLIKFVILLHKVLFDYVTLFDVYEGAINPERLEQLIKMAETSMATQSVRISMDNFMAARELETFPFERDGDTDQMSAPLSDDLLTTLEKNGIVYELPARAEPLSSVRWTPDRCRQFAAVKRWFEQDWRRLEPRLRTSIVEGIAVFLSLFDDNPAVKRVFCPPKETYDPVLNQDGRYGRPLPPFAELIEQGVVCALNFPVSANPGLARAIGTFMKQDYQRAVLNRIPAMERSPERHFRQTLFLCDEYHAFATVGENDPSGDEKFFALSRQARCIAIVATQSISSLRSTLPAESWRTLLQTFRTKIFLALSDDFSAKTASDLCGRAEQLRPQYTLSEQGQDAAVSMLTGQAASHRTSVGTSKSYSVQRDLVFEPKVFMELRNAQAIVLAYDGVNPHPPTYCYLKPYYLDPHTSYFEHLKRGAI